MIYSREIIDILKKKNVNFVVDSYLGPVPFELDEMYPLAQSVFPLIIDQETRQNVQQVVERFFKNKTVIRWDEYTVINEEKSLTQDINLDMRRIFAVADMQFGRGVSKVLLNGEITIIKSKRTGKISNVMSMGIHKGSLGEYKLAQPPIIAEYRRMGCLGGRASPADQRRLRRS